LDKIKRYIMGFTVNGDIIPKQWSGGPWVRYEDVAPLLKQEVSMPTFLKCEGYTLEIHKEENPAATDHKMWAEIKSLPGFIAAGDSEEEILKEAKRLIPAFKEAADGKNL